MGSKDNQIPVDFTFIPSDEPHASRRKKMLIDHPEIDKLYGYDLLSAVQVTVCVLVQVLTSYYMADASWPVLLAVAYAWGGTINHSLMLAIHEICHDLMLPKTWMNEWFGIFCSLPIAMPISLGFKKYHLMHHRYQGIPYQDPDIPTLWEGRNITSPLAKLLFLMLQPLFYTLRPLIILPTPLTTMEIYAWTTQITFNLSIAYFLGGKALAYLFLGSILGSGLHPLAAHFIAEHYLWDRKNNYETYSYYGPLNVLVYNVGWHNEHHDFPRIPGSKLPELHKIAPEYYKDIGVHNSWPMLYLRFLTDPTLTPFARVTRKGKKK